MLKPQSTIVSKYDRLANKLVGFETEESFVDSNIDASLLDNATGATNYAAPGANRLKLNPVLAVRNPGTHQIQMRFLQLLILKTEKL